MKITKSEKFEDVLIFEPTIYEDNRGFFFESFNNQITDSLNVNFVQDNHSKSKKNVVRGIHYQWEPKMGKLCRVVSGYGRDFFVDLRKNSPTYGQYDSVFLNEENNKIIWVPSGFGHAFLSLEDNTHLVYKCSGYHSNNESSIFPLDNDLSIDWGVDVNELVLSEKDLNSQSFSDYDKNPIFYYEKN